MLEKKILIPVRWALAPMLVCTGAAAWAAIVQAVSGSQQGGGEVVRIELSEPLKDAVTGFAIQSPARIALDLPGATNAMGQSLVDLQQGNLDTVNVVEGTGRTRVVLNLKAPTTYRTQVDGNGILVFLDPVKRTASTIAPVQSTMRQHLASKEVDASTPGALKNIDFRRGSDGAGRLVVDLGSAMVNADVRKEGKGLTIDLLNSSLPAELRRRLDVVDFATPVQMITASQNGDRVRQLIVQVLVNLLDNAFKHTPDASKVMLKAFVRNNNIIFQVIDNGKGIEIKQLNHIFDDFFTTSLDNGDHKRGIGLGLAICKAIVEAHKGEIKAFNNDLGGATFELSLPLEEENNE